MAPLWGRGSVENPFEAAPFDWSAEAMQRFRNTVRPSANGDPACANVNMLITQRVESRNSWNLDTEAAYFGWVLVEEAWGLAGLVRLPLALELSVSAVEYTPRRSDGKKSLASLGTLYLWRRGKDGPPDGFGASLSLDRLRFDALELAVGTHRGAIAPFLTLEINAPVTDDGATDFPIAAYWLKTLPLDHGGANNHPYAKESFE